MSHRPVWALLGAADRAVMSRLRMLVNGIDPVPPEVVSAAESLGQRIASCRRVMVTAEVID
jgi:hypothetical protein